MTDKNSIEKFRNEVSGFLEIQQKRHARNFKFHWALVFGVLIGSSLATVGGIFKWSHDIIAFIGVVSSAVIVIHTAIAIGDKAEFQRIVASDAANILTYLSNTNLSDEEFTKLRDQFIALRKHADSQLPRGGGMEAVRNLPKAPT